MNVKWYNGSTLLADETYNVDSSTYFCDTQVQAYNKIVITIGNMQKPNRFLKIFNISDGVTRQFYNDELENVEIIEQITNNNKALNINEATLKLLPANTTGVLFQRTLPFSIYRNDVLMGRFFISTSTSNTNKTLYNIKVSDYINTLESQTYLGGTYANIGASTLVGQILGDIPYSVDATLTNKVINGYLPILSKREALRQVAFCLNAYVDTSRSDMVNILPLPTTTSATKTASDIVSIETTQKNIVTKYELNTKIIATSSTATTEEIFNEALNGTKMIVYDSPKYSLQISNGTVVSSNCNYALISGTGGNVVLQGKSYAEYTTTTEKTNPNTISTDIDNVESYTTTIICSTIDILDSLSFVEYSIKSKFKMGSVKIGDLITLNGQTCRVLSLSYDLKQSEMYCDAELEAYYE